MKKGEILFDKYRVERKLGSGGMSDVYLVTNIQLGNRWAMKFVKNSRIAETETDILKKLNHRSLPQVADVFRDEYGTYIIESYIEGATLQQKLTGESSIGIIDTLGWMLQLCEVLAYLHEHKPHPIIYRDLKPSNILVTREKRIVLVDFGISKILRGCCSQDKVIAGTNAYAAPEQLIHDGHSDSRSDIYSLGAIMKQLFQSGSKDMQAAGNKTLRQAHSIVCRCMEKRPENRFQSVDELKQQLEKLSYELSFERAKDKLFYRLLVILSVVLSIITYGITVFGLLIE